LGAPCARPSGVVLVTRQAPGPSAGVRSVVVTIDPRGPDRAGFLSVEAVGKGDNEGATELRAESPRRTREVLVNLGTATH
jgi:hypothetical protein